MALNIVFLTLGAALIGFGVHIHTSQENQLLRDKIYIGVIAVGSAFLVLSVIGICGICMESNCVVGVYEALLVILAAGTVAVAVILLTPSNSARSLVTEAWKDSSVSTRLDAQNYFFCCGLDTFNDTLAAQPCPVNSTNACADTVINHLQDNYWIIGGLSGGVGLLQLVAIVISSVLLCKKWGSAGEEALLLDENGRVTPRSKNRRRRNDGFGKTGWITEEP